MSAVALQSFGFEGQTVRVMDRRDAPWFVAQDVCACLEIGNHRQAVSRLDEDERDAVTTSDAIGRMQEQVIISESGLYALIFKSRKQAAIRFRKWVTSEVLPALRRTGHYNLAAANDTPLQQMSLDDMERLRVGMAVVNTACRTWGIPAGRTVWERLGLPDVRNVQGADGLFYSPHPVDLSIERWIADRTDPCEPDATDATVLYQDYMDWCSETGETAWMRSGFEKQIRLRGYAVPGYRRGAKIGLALKD